MASIANSRRSQQLTSRILSCTRFSAKYFHATTSMSLRATSIVQQSVAKPHVASRKPSIHFRFGDRKTIDVEMGIASSGSGSNSASEFFAPVEDSLDVLFPSKPGAVDFLSMPPMFGRPVMGELEELCIVSGGAVTEIPKPPVADKKKKSK